MLALKALGGSAKEKFNPVQPLIAGDQGSFVSSTEPVTTYMTAYERLDIVHRGVSMVVDDVAQLGFKVFDQFRQIAPVQSSNLKRSSIERILNQEANPHQDISHFRRNLITDLITEGNAFVYFDGKFLFHLPAHNVTIIPDERDYVKGYRYSGLSEVLLPDEVIHIKENSVRTIYRGQSRLKACRRAINTLYSMREFQDNFFKNNAIPGLLLQSENVLSAKIKERTVESWMATYNPKSGGRRPLILDGGMKLSKISDLNFKELDFESSVDNLNETILKAIGIPPILLDGGNNANIRPNLRLYYIETVLPLARRIAKAFERFFGFVIKEDAASVPGLQPELKEQAGYLTSLVNGGIITPNEARAEIGKAALTDTQGEGDVIRIPANIAGSAGDPGEGGRPPSDEDD